MYSSSRLHLIQWKVSLSNNYSLSLLVKLYGFRKIPIQFGVSSSSKNTQTSDWYFPSLLLPYATLIIFDSLKGIKSCQTHRFSIIKILCIALLEIFAHMYVCTFFYYIT